MIAQSQSQWVETVRRLIASGELDAVRVGRRTIRVKIESIDRLIDAHPVVASLLPNRVSDGVPGSTRSRR